MQVLGGGQLKDEHWTLGTNARGRRSTGHVTTKLSFKQQTHRTLTPKLFDFPNNDSEANQKRKVIKEELEISKIVSVIIVGCLLFYILPNIVLTSLTISGVSLSPNFGLYVSVCQSFNSPLNAVLFLWRDMPMRKAFLKMPATDTFLGLYFDESVVYSYLKLFVFALFITSLTVARIKPFVAGSLFSGHM
uniref:G-protein coupled receptors family 1 profile domain-containing protein n=1 Tax=Romanomermis culicivorax TaxID=13658 RepID=A0A915JEW0_ROMCU